jgi:putative copper resistance protein D
VFRESHFLADVVHLLCAAAWLGALNSLIPLLHRAVRHDDEQFLGIARVSVARFSRMGYVAVGLLLATGVLNTVSIVRRPELLITSEYGRLLLIKIGLGTLMVGISLVNRFILVSRLYGSERSGAHQASVALYRNAVAEQLIGVLVFAIVAVLGTVHPPQ